MTTTKTSLLALTAAFLSLSAPAQAADVYTPADAYQAPSTSAPARVNWNGLYVGGQVGYGIASGQVTTLSTENFDAVPSRCFGEGSINAEGEHDLDGDPTTTDDIFPAEAFANGGFAVIGLTEDQCVDLVGEPTSGSGSFDPNDPTSPTYAYETGFDPAVDAHSVTTKSTQDLHEAGLIGGARAGFDYTFGQFLAGVLGGYNWSAISGKEGEWFVGGRAGILLDERVLAYGVVAWTGTEFGGQNYDGITYGGGLEYALNHKMFVGLEYTHTDYGSETLVNTPTLNVKSDIDEDRFMATLRVNLNSDLFGR